VYFGKKHEEEKIMEMVKRTQPLSLSSKACRTNRSTSTHNPALYEFRRITNLIQPHHHDVLRRVPKEGVECCRTMTSFGYGSTSDSFRRLKVFTPWRSLEIWDNYTPTRSISSSATPTETKRRCAWGETLGAATPDEYDKLVHSFDCDHPTRYELADMTKV